ncbi:hypothetical protein Tsubulata_025521 [Turnera subulata]|uniref:FYVE-type domain-containing protein n=1 Tax=Turnera subulata TaxID=218843 RepID=A0A9Q0J6U1_9ROSI|nr:hypothetical protein Tsubulata_025521 [Turnera subulata]
MLEKIGLPAKPSLRGNNWVVDATHCQGCSSQFTFINRKHHCRRCGGLFCGSCTQQRMVLRGQGDSPVRICEACKKLEEAARFELRHGHKNRAGRGSSKLTSSQEDELLKQILSNDANGSSSEGRQSVVESGSSFQRASSTASSITTQEVASLDGEREIHSTRSVDEPNHQLSETGSTSPEGLRQRALDERKTYKVLKGKGKSEEALKAFKRAKDLERQADALELSIKKNRRKVLMSGSAVETQNEDRLKEPGRKGKEKDDLISELRQIGWSDMDLHDEDKRPANMSLEGELSSLLGDVAGRTNKDTGTSSIEKTQVVAHKRKALALKREGKLAEAKEELKKAKALEKKLEEQEVLGTAEDSDDEISALIRSMDNDKEDNLLVGYEQEYGFDIDHLTGVADDIGVDDSFEVTDEDLVDPEIAATLQSLGWEDDSNNPVNIESGSVAISKEALRSEILSLKKEALNQKRAGNVPEAMAHLKKAKLLERDLENFEEPDTFIRQDHTTIQRGSSTQNIKTKSDVDSKLAPKNRLMIQKELLTLKKKALALRREGKMDEAEEELKKGRVLEQQLEELDNASKVKDYTIVGSKEINLADEHSDVFGSSVGEQGGEDVTDQDMSDPAYLSILRNLGWKDEDKEPKESQLPLKERRNHHSMKSSSLSVTEGTSDTPIKRPRRSKAEVQRELLSLKRKALSLRREGKIDEAEEVLASAKMLEAEMAAIEAPRRELEVEVKGHNDDITMPLESATEEDVVDISEKDMHDPALLSILNTLGWSDDGHVAQSLQGNPSNQASTSSVHSDDPSVPPMSSWISVAKPRSKGEIQRELLGLKRKALALRRKGETEEAEELLKMAKVLESQMEDVAGQMGPLPSESMVNNEKLGGVEDVLEMKAKSAILAKGSPETSGEPLLGLGGKECGTAAPLTSADGLRPVPSQRMEDNYALIGKVGPRGDIGYTGYARMNQGTGLIPPTQQPVDLVDLLTGNGLQNLQIEPDKAEESSWHPEPRVQDESKSPPNSFRSKQDEVKFESNTLRSKDDVTTKKRDGEVNVDNKPLIFDTNSAPEVSSTNNKNSLRQEVLIRKRKAVALKKEGKLAEAREELRQAKLLEKSLEEETPALETGAQVMSVNVPIAPPVQHETPAAPTVPPKLLSGRDRFKLQQESLSHKREALKLRREGRMEEAEAKFELAKALEAQLEEASSQDSTKSSANVAEPLDDVIVEDLLDPQLLSALKGIGIDDGNTPQQQSDRPVSAKVNATTSENISQERIQLEERIKAEKVKAVNLKRAGKQTEALDALRRAKLFEKKLNSLSSN